MMACKTSTGPTLSVPYGSAKSLPVIATVNGQDKDLTGYTLVFTVAAAPMSTEYLIKKTAVLDTPTEPVKGHVFLSAEDLSIPPGKYSYDSVLWIGGEKLSSKVGAFIVEPVVNTDTAP